MLIFCLNSVYSKWHNGTDSIIISDAFIFMQAIVCIAFKPICLQLEVLTGSLTLKRIRICSVRRPGTGGKLVEALRMFLVDLT